MIGDILGTVSAVAGVAESMAKRAEQGQLIDAGDARGVARSLREVHDQLQRFNVAARRLDTDGEFAKRVLGEYTSDS